MRWRWLLSIGLVAVTLAGCGGKGPELVEVTGKVSLDGRPLEGARLVFVPADGRPSSGITDANGHYELKFSTAKDGALPGEHLVRISTQRRADPDRGLKASPERIPAKYNVQSDVKRTVDKAATVLDFEVSSAEGKVIQTREDR